MVKKEKIKWQYNSVYVDEKYSGVVIDALRTDTWLVPGAALFTDYATGDVAGGVVNFYSFAAAALQATIGGTTFQVQNLRTH